MHAIQILAVLFAAFAFSRVLLRFKDGRISWREFLGWSALWLAVIIVAFIPGITFFFSKLVGITRGIDFVVYISIIVLFYLVFRIYVKLEAMEQGITKIVREISLKKK